MDPDIFENEYDDEENLFEVEQKQYEDKITVTRRTGLIASDYDFPQLIVNKAHTIYTQLMEEKYFERINKIANIAFVCFYYASNELGYNRTPQEIAERVKVCPSTNLMTVLRDFSYLYTSYKKSPKKTSCEDYIKEYREEFPTIDKDYDKVIDLWKEISSKEPGIAINKNPIVLAASTMILYVNNYGTDENEVELILDKLYLNYRDIKRYIKNFDAIYNS